jgi:hypothetical protein
MQDPPRSKILPHLRTRRSRFVSETEPQLPKTGVRRGLRMALTAGAMLFTLFVIYPIIERTMQHEETAGSVQVTSCDRLAAHPSDTQKLAAGVAQEQMDVAAARDACLKALGEHPGNGRILYELSRTYSAGGDAVLGLSYLHKSAEAGYAHGQFILADTLIHGDDPQVCVGGQLLAKAARQHHFPSKIALAVDWLNGTLKSCNLDVTDGEITQLLSAAAELAETEDEKNELAVIAAKWSGRLP